MTTTDLRFSVPLAGLHRATTVTGIGNDDLRPAVDLETSQWIQFNVHILPCGVGATGPEQGILQIKKS